jgi:hypothetical protein
MKWDLDTVWALTLEMWEWIVKEVSIDPDKKVNVLKREWLSQHIDGYLNMDVQCDCLFCDYDHRQMKQSEKCCCHCPGMLVDPDFECEVYGQDPELFYADLQELDCIRRVSLEEGTIK